jgi:catechol 2,3-dioxygenase-like lactoylglutathione lyase family enzyme
MAKARKPSRKPAKAVARKAMKKSAPKKGVPRKATAKKPAAKKVVAKAPLKPAGSELLNVGIGITADDATASTNWYCDVLGFNVVDRWDSDGFVGARLVSGGVTVNINQDDWKQGRERIKGQGVRFFVIMGPDVDGYAAAIKSRGGALAQEPVSEWGMRAFSINDPDGYKLTFMHVLS